jgi:2-iminobutanoate/2-iminopropanoate deaminase
MGSRVGPLVCSSAIMGTDRATGKVPADAAEQVRLVFGNLRAFLAAAGVGAEHVARVGVLLGDSSVRGTVNEEWTAMFPDPASRPARHTTVKELPNAMAIQLEVIAFAGQD